MCFDQIATFVSPLDIAAIITMHYIHLFYSAAVDFVDVEYHQKDVIFDYK